MLHLTTMKSLVLLFLAAVLPFKALAADVAKITPQEADKLVADGKAVLVDVREPAEWQETGVAEKAVLLPKSDFDGAQKLWKEFLAHNGDKEVILYCRSGKRAGVIGETLAAKGIKVANAGGFSDWRGAGLPTRRVEPSK
jgi:rhodanese-related sulfurtransferase